jgi:hypothetical protein
MKCLFLRIKNLRKVQAKVWYQRDLFYPIRESTSLLDDGYYKGW